MLGVRDTAGMLQGDSLVGCCLGPPKRLYREGIALRFSKAAPILSPVY
jgi:hypothetical protein